MTDGGAEGVHPRLEKELGSDLELEQYRLHAPLEVARVLRELGKSRELITAHCPRGENDFMLTSVLGVDSDHRYLFLDYGQSKEANRQMQEAETITFVGRHNGVRIQFSAGPFESIELKSGPAFRAPLPGSVIRIQRREFYRLALSRGRPLRARITPPGQEPLEVNVVDISIGGIGILEVEPDDTTLWEPGTTFPDSLLELPDHAIRTEIEVRNRFELPRADARSAHRIGCRFLSLSPSDAAAIQRYIHRVELARRRAE